MLAAIFAILAGTHVIQMWSVYLLALSLGFVNVFDNPARQSFISEMVPPDDLPNAVTLNSVSMNLARVFGAAVGGVLAAVLGLALCFACNAISFGAVLLSLAAMNGALLYPAKPVKKKPGQIRAGLRYVRETPELLIPLLMIALVGTLAWEFQVTLPLMASEVFGGGAASYGVMASVMGVGAVGGGLISAARSRPRARSLCVAAIGWGIAITAAAVAPTLPLELVALVFVGYGSITFNSYAKTTLQLAADPAMRGRVMALWGLAWLGSTPIGGPLVGWIAQEAGARWSTWWWAGSRPSSAVSSPCQRSPASTGRRLPGPPSRQTEPYVSRAAGFLSSRGGRQGRRGAGRQRCLLVPAVPRSCRRRPRTGPVPLSRRPAPGTPRREQRASQGGGCGPRRCHFALISANRHPASCSRSTATGPAAGMSM